MAGVRAAEAFAATFIVHRYRRRPLFKVNAATIFFSNTVMAVHGLATEFEFVGDELKRAIWFTSIPLACVIVNYAGMAFGYGNILNAMGGEILPIEAKSIGNT